MLKLLLKAIYYIKYVKKWILAYYLIHAIKKNADAVPDYRHSSYAKHLLSNVIMLTFFALLGNANEWDEIESFAKRKSTGEGKTRALPTLNIYASDYGICIGQKFIEEKTNEIPAAQEILPLFALVENCIVTADAMNRQKGTVPAIVKGKGDYALALKENQPLFYADVQTYFNEDTLKEVKGTKGGWYKTAEKEHGKR